MNVRNFFLVLLISLLCGAAQASEDKCEEAIAQKVKATKKPETVAFVSEARKAIPHGPLTHYAGKGVYVMPDGESAQFEWFCDVKGASGKPENLFVAVSKIDAPAEKAENKKGETPKDEAKPTAKPNKPWVQECQSVVEAEIRKKNPSFSHLDFQSGKVSRASHSEDLVEGEGSFTGTDKPDEEMKFSYRCAYNVEKGKITAKSVRMK